MLSWLLVQSKRIVKCSIMEITFSVMLFGACDRAMKASVAMSLAFQVSHAVFLPLVANADTVSQPVKAWNTGRAFDLSGPKELAISWADMYLKFLPVPNATHSSSMFSSSMYELLKSSYTPYTHYTPHTHTNL